MYQWSGKGQVGPRQHCPQAIYISQISSPTRKKLGANVLQEDHWYGREHQFFLLPLFFKSF